MVFMKNILKIHDVKRRFVEDPFRLLNDILHSYLVRIPFQGITSMGSVKITENGRRILNLRDLIACSVTGTGGVCAHNNYYLRLQLESIGYDITTVTGCFRRTGVEGTHCLNIVKVKPNRKSEPKSYLIDVGCGIELHELVSLLDLPYRSRAGGLNFRYEQIDDWTLQRVNENGDALMGKKSEDYLSPQDYTINLKPTDLTTFLGNASKVYANPKATFPPAGTYCFRYLNIEDNDYKCVCIRGLDLVIFTKETQTVQSFKDYYQLRPSIYKYFPMINKEHVDLAVKYYNQQLIDESLK